MSDAQTPNDVTTTIVGPTIVIKGKLKSGEDLVVRGRIDATITSTRALLVENSGIVKANVRVKSARISGTLVGNIHAEEKVEIASDGRVVGELYSPMVSIKDGAAFRGKIDMEGGSAATEAAPAPAPAKAATSSPSSPAPPASAATPSSLSSALSAAAASRTPAGGVPLGKPAAPPAATKPTSSSDDTTS